MDLLPPFIRKYGMIPESYKLAMTYEEQLLWLCEFIEDLQDQFDEFKTVVQNLENLVNTFDQRITNLSLRVDRNAIDIAHLIDRLDEGLPFKYLTDNILLTDLNPDLASGYYYTGNYQIRTTLGIEAGTQYRVIFDTDTLLIYDSSTPKTFKLIKDKQVSNLINYYVTADNDTNNWVVTRNEISTTTVNQYSDNYQIPTALAVWNAIQSSSGLIEKLPNSITLTNETVPLTTGLYYTDQYTVKTTTGSILQEETLMIPQYTLFYYDGTHNTFTLLYNEYTTYRDTWLKERWHWFQDTSGVLPDTSAWQIKRYRADDDFDFYPSQSDIPTSYALSKVIPKILQPSTLTTGNYFDIQGIVFEGSVINPPTASSNTAYCFFDISELTSLKFRVTGGCTNYTWFTTDIIPTDTVNQIHIETMSNQDTGFTNEIIEVVTKANSHYVVFNFDNTDLTAPSVEVLETELDISQLVNSSSTEFEVPSAKAVYTALQNASGLTPITSSSIRIWDLNVGYYEIQNSSSTTIYYNGATTMQSFSTSFEHSYLIISSAVGSTTKNYFLNEGGVKLHYGNVSSSSGNHNQLNITNVENNQYKVTSLSASSTDTQYPSAKAVYDFSQYDVKGNGNTSSVVTTIWSGTETEYNSIVSPDSATLYFIKE